MSRESCWWKCWWVVFCVVLMAAAVIVLTFMGAWGGCAPGTVRIESYPNDGADMTYMEIDVRPGEFVVIPIASFSTPAQTDTIYVDSIDPLWLTLRDRMVGTSEIPGWMLSEINKRANQLVKLGHRTR